MSQPEIKSPWGRLLLKPPSSADDAAVAALYNDAETQRYIPSRLVKSAVSLEDCAKIRASQAENPAICRFHIYQLPGHERSGDPLFVGYCQLNNRDANTCSGEAGISLSSNIHRQGIATEALYILLSYAFDSPDSYSREHPQLNFQRIYFITALDNIRMRTWLESFAFRVEEELRNQDGWPDANVYAVLAGEEWMALKERLVKKLTARLGEPIC